MVALIILSKLTDALVSIYRGKMPRTTQLLRLYKTTHLLNPSSTQLVSKIRHQHRVKQLLHQQTTNHINISTDNKNHKYDEKKLFDIIIYW